MSAALTQASSRQADVEAKTNEIPLFTTLLDHVDLAGAVVTADALHAQRAHAEYLAGQRGAHYLITVKRNQPGLHAQLAGLPGGTSPSPAGRGTKATAVPGGAP